MSVPREAFELDIDPARVAEWITEDSAPQVIDVRETYEREAGHIAGTRHI
jgi:rhodanese-related sulfurtransferase